MRFPPGAAGMVAARSPELRVVLEKFLGKIERGVKLEGRLVAALLQDLDRFREQRPVAVDVAHVEEGLHFLMREEALPGGEIRGVVMPGTSPGREVGV